MATNSNLASVEEKLEWLLNCVPSGISEGYDTLRVVPVIELGLQSELLVRRCIEMNIRKEKQKNANQGFFYRGNFRDAGASNDIQAMSNNQGLEALV